MSIPGYPSMIALHALGMAIMVGLSLVLDLRLLGWFAGIPLAALQRFFGLAWIGFGINFVSGSALFSAQATSYIVDWVFMTQDDARAARRHHGRDPATGRREIRRGRRTDYRRHESHRGDRDRHLGRAPSSWAASRPISRSRAHGCRNGLDGDDADQHARPQLRVELADARVAALPRAVHADGLAADHGSALDRLSANHSAAGRAQPHAASRSSRSRSISSRAWASCSATRTRTSRTMRSG